MTNNKANKSKILALILGLTMCISLMKESITAKLTLKDDKYRNKQLNI